MILTSYIRISLSMLVIAFASIHSAAASSAKALNKSEQINYSIGYQIGSDFKTQGWIINPDFLIKGLKDAQSGNKPVMTVEEMKTTLVSLKKQLIDLEAESKKTPSDNQKVIELQQTKVRADKQFLEENSKKPGVTVLPSGVQFKVIKAGSERKPTVQDDVLINFRTTLVDGKEIASTYKQGKPRRYNVSKTLSGLREILPMMSEGATWQVVLPPLTGSHERELLQSHNVLIYDIELVSIIDKSLKPNK